MKDSSISTSKAARLASQVIYKSNSPASHALQTTDHVGLCPEGHLGFAVNPLSTDPDSHPHCRS